MSDPRGHLKKDIKGNSGQRLGEFNPKGIDPTPTPLRLSNMLDNYIGVVATLCGYQIWCILIHESFPLFEAINYVGSLYISHCCLLRLSNMLDPNTWILTSMWDHQICWILSKESLPPIWKLNISKGSSFLMRIPWLGLGWGYPLAIHTETTIVK